MSNPTANLPPAAGTPAPAPKHRKPLRERSPVLAHLRSVLFAGLLTAIPIFITVFILTKLYELVTTYTQPPADWLIDHLLGTTATGHTAAAATAAILMSLLIVYVLGLLGSFFIGRQILAQIEHFIENLPLIKGIYGTTKQVIAVFRKGGGGAGFQRVVLVEFPRLGTWTIAFVTNTVTDAATGKMVCCFIPMTPNPTSGFFQMFPESQVRDTDWSVDMGIKIVLSGGLLAPSDLHSHAAKAANVTTILIPTEPLTSATPSAPFTSITPSAPLTSVTPSAPLTSVTPSEPLTSVTPSAPAPSATPSAPSTN